MYLLAPGIQTWRRGDKMASLYFLGSKVRNVILCSRDKYGDLQLTRIIPTHTDTVM